MDTFKDKVAFVTGGASGIGRALCIELGCKEAIVVVADIDEEGAKEVAASINSNGGRAKAYHLDVTLSVPSLLPDIRHLGLAPK